VLFRSPHDDVAAPVASPLWVPRGSKPSPTNSNAKNSSIAPIYSHTANDMVDEDECDTSTAARGGRETRGVPSAAAAASAVVVVAVDSAGGSGRE